MIAGRATALGGTALGTLQVGEHRRSQPIRLISLPAASMWTRWQPLWLHSAGLLAPASTARLERSATSTPAVYSPNVSRGIDSDLGLLEAHVQAER